MAAEPGRHRYIGLLQLAAAKGEGGVMEQWDLSTTRLRLTDSPFLVREVDIDPVVLESVE